MPITVKTLNPGRKFKKERYGRNVLSFTRVKRITFYNSLCVLNSLQLAFGFTTIIQTESFHYKLLTVVQNKSGQNLLKSMFLILNI